LLTDFFFTYHDKGKLESRQFGDGIEHLLLGLLHVDLCNAVLGNGRQDDLAVVGDPGMLLGFVNRNALGWILLQQQHQQVEEVRVGVCGVLDPFFFCFFWGVARISTFYF